MAQYRRQCKNCGRFGHFQKTCKNAKVSQSKFQQLTRKAPVNEPNQIEVSQSLGVTEMEVSQPDKDPPTLGAALGAESFAAELDAGSEESGEESGPVYSGEVVQETESKSQEPSGPTPGEVGFKKSIETVLTIWEIALNHAAGASIAPPAELKDLVAQAWTDCAKAQGWLEHANDPRIAAVLAVGLTAGTYGVATYEVVLIKQAAKKAGR